MKHIRILCLAFLLFAPACGDDNPAEPSFDPSLPTSQVLSGILEPGASGSFPFIVGEPAQVRITLASLGLNPNGSAVSANMMLGFGTPSGTECTPQTSTDAFPALTAQIVRVIDSAGTYCARVTDIGNLQNAAEVAVRVHIVPFSAPGPLVDTAGTDTFTTNLSAGGWMSRSIRSSRPGTISLRLHSAGPPDTIILGLGLGVTRTDGTGCLLTQAVGSNAGGSPQISLPADAGVYCARIYDVGQITVPITFTAAIVKP